MDAGRVEPIVGHGGILGRNAAPLLISPLEIGSDDGDAVSRQPPAHVPQRRRDAPPTRKQHDGGPLPFPVGSGEIGVEAAGSGGNVRRSEEDLDRSLAFEDAHEPGIVVGRT